jgi:hypothetical protein
MEPLSTIIAGAAITEAVDFLCAQGAEVLRTWRQRRNDRDAASPKVLQPANGVTVAATGKVLADPPARDVEDTLQDLLEAVGVVREGAVPPETEEARKAVGYLRDYLEQVLGASITIEGEQPRQLTVRDVRVDAETVRDSVVGVRAALDRIAEQTLIERVDVHARGAKDVTGVDLT